MSILWALEGCLHVTFRASTYKWKITISRPCLSFLDFECLRSLSVSFIFKLLLWFSNSFRQVLLWFTLNRGSVSCAAKWDLPKQNTTWTIFHKSTQRPFSKAAWGHIVKEMLWLCSDKQYLVLVLHVLLKTVMSYKLFKRCCCRINLCFSAPRWFRRRYSHREKCALTHSQKVGLFHYDAAYDQHYISCNRL